MGSAGSFGRGNYMPHDYNQPYRNRLATGSYYMDPEEIDSILRIQWKSLHSGSPYVEDYYYLVSKQQGSLDCVHCELINPLQISLVFAHFC